MKVHIVRHAECVKNLIGIPGGCGAPLTPKGVIEAEKVSRKLRTLLSDNPILITCPPKQTIETAAIIGENLKTSYEVEPLLASIDLGVLAGVPISVANMRFPEDSRAMALWRARALEISELEIGGMERPWEFYCRGLRGITKYRSHKEVIICATTSIMILVSHISTKTTPNLGDGYRAIDFSNVEVASFDFSSRD